MTNVDPSKVERCVGCSSPNLFDFFQLDKSPVNCGTLPNSRKEALAARTGKIELVYCCDCELVFNQAFDGNLIDFEPGYEVALTHSKVFRDFQASVVEHLMLTFDLHGKRILEIGCGDGAFLKLICRRGANLGVGIDPTVPEIGTQKLDKGRVRFIREFFNPDFENEIGDFICSLSVFEDIPEPCKFLLMLRKMIGARQPGIYFEVFNGFRAIDSGEIWSIHYEQCNYFGLKTLEQMFRKNGFTITDSGMCYKGDQYLYIESVPDPAFDFTEGRLETAISDHARVPSVISEFANNFQKRMVYWKQRLIKANDESDHVVLWGSGGKGISFLNAVSGTDAIAVVCDINPDRQGSFIPGTGHEIVGPKQLVGRPPDLVILSNPIYETEIRYQLDVLGMRPEFDFV